jgi:hypothetical protein
MKARPGFWLRLFVWPKRIGLVNSNNKSCYFLCTAVIFEAEIGAPAPIIDLILAQTTTNLDCARICTLKTVVLRS